jgi:hypothetical protein
MRSKSSTKAKKLKKISAEEFDEMFDRGDDVTPYVDFENAVVVRRVNIDFSAWMLRRLDQEARKLNVSRQAIIKMWISERIVAERQKRGR